MAGHDRKRFTNPSQV